MRHYSIHFLDISLFALSSDRGMDYTIEVRDFDHVLCSPVVAMMCFFLKLPDTERALQSIENGYCRIWSNCKIFLILFLGSLTRQ